MSIYLRCTAHLVSGEPCLLPALADFVFVAVPPSNTPILCANYAKRFAIDPYSAAFHDIVSSPSHFTPSIPGGPAPTQGKSSRNSS